jgi:uncharacterized protein YqeY
MRIEERISADLKTAMKERNENVKSLLRVIIGEFGRVDTRGREGKEIYDTEATTILKKMKENAVLMNRPDEVEIIERYLPKMVDEIELRGVIAKILSEKTINSMAGMGIIMSELKAKYGSAYDGKLASQIAKELIN